MLDKGYELVQVSDLKHASYLCTTYRAMLELYVNWFLSSPFLLVWFYRPLHLAFNPLLQMILVLIIFSGYLVVDVVFIAGFVMGKRGGYTISSWIYIYISNSVLLSWHSRIQNCTAFTLAGWQMNRGHLLRNISVSTR